MFAFSKKKNIYVPQNSTYKLINNILCLFKAIMRISKLYMFKNIYGHCGTYIYNSDLISFHSKAHTSISSSRTISLCSLEFSRSISRQRFYHFPLNSHWIASWILRLYFDLFCSFQFLLSMSQKITKKSLLHTSYTQTGIHLVPLHPLWFDYWHSWYSKIMPRLACISLYISMRCQRVSSVSKLKVTGI